MNRIVEEVKQSDEWEVVSMNILDIGIAKGMERGIEQIYENAKELIVMGKEDKDRKKGTVE